MKSRGELLQRTSPFITGNPSADDIQRSTIKWPSSYVCFLSEFGGGFLTSEMLPEGTHLNTIASCCVLEVFSPFETSAKHNLYSVSARIAASWAVIFEFAPDGFRTGFWKGDLLPIGSFSGGDVLCFRNHGIDREWTITIIESAYTVRHYELTFGDYIDAALQGGIDLHTGDEPGTTQFFWYPTYEPKDLETGCA